MAVLCGMPTIQYSARSGLLSVHKLLLPALDYEVKLSDTHMPE